MPRCFIEYVTLGGNYITLRRQIVQPQKWKEYTGKSFIPFNGAHLLKSRIALFVGISSFHIFFTQATYKHPLILT